MAAPTKVFSRPLWKQTIKSNAALFIIIIVILSMMTTVITFAMSLMQTETVAEDVTDAQEEFYTYLTVIANYNDMFGCDMSYDNFKNADDKSPYEGAFELINKQQNMDLSVDGFQTCASTLETSEMGIDKYIKQFEYIYALNMTKGCFDEENLSIQEMIEITMEAQGISTDTLEKMGDMDTTAMLNQMYFTVMGLLPLFLFIAVIANSLIASQVDNGSMAYTLSTPTKRTAIVITQGLYMILSPAIIIAIICIVKNIATNKFFGSVDTGQYIRLYLGMYVLCEAICGICFCASCWFNQSKKSMAVGGGLTVWFFLASLLGMFGSENLMSMGVGVEQLSVFNKLTLIGLYDIDAIAIGDTSAYMPKLLILLAITVITYLAGSIRFCKKDLPL